MAIKQALAVKQWRLRQAARLCQPLSEVTNGWVALVIKAADKN